MQRRKTMNKKIWKQADSRWSGKPYPVKSSTFGGNGCGCCACVHVAMEQDRYKGWTPESLRTWMISKGFAIKGQGTTWNGITETLKHIGHSTVVRVWSDPMSSAWKELNKGNRIGILLFNSNKAPNGTRWTAGGHYVAFTDYKVQNGLHYFYCKDSGGRNHDGWYTYEKSMKGCIAKVWIVERVGKQTDQTVKATTYKPTTAYSGTLPAGTVKKGTKGSDAKALQTFLNWCINAKLTVDGDAGDKTVEATEIYQKTYGLEADGIFGAKSKAKAQEIINSLKPKTVSAKYTGETPNVNVTKTETVSCGADVVARAKEYCWPKGTDAKKWKYKTGKPLDVFKAALKKYMKKTAKISQSDCGYFVNTVVRSLGISSTFLALKGTKEAFPKPTGNVKIVHTGAVTEAKLQKGDIIRYKKTNGHQHTLIYYGDGCVAEAGRETRFPVIQKSKKYNASNVKKNTLEVLRCYKTKTVTRAYLQKGDNGTEVKKIQKFLNWYGNFGLTVDGDWGSKTDAAVKVFQTDKFGAKEADGKWGPKCVAAMKTTAQKTSSPSVSVGTTQTKTFAEKVLEFARKIGKDDSYHYVRWTSDTKTHECPICHNHAKGAYHGWNCIGFAFACWHHGGGLKSKCNCGVISDAVWEDILKAKTDAEALKIAQKRIGIDSIKVIRNKNGIKQSDLKPADICATFNGTKYTHTWVYSGNGKMVDCTSGNTQISERKAATAKVAIRYIGK